ncbi:MAG TPA: FtsX-like permease family protein, partial [Bryobacteraceae bacterium]
AVLFDEALKKYAEPQLKRFLHLDDEGLKKSGAFLRVSLMPLTRIHLYSHEPGELGANGSIQYVYIFSAIAIFILVIACVNFMNLSTARATERAREVGVRKVLGSERRSLILQFLVESVLLSFLSLLIALCATWLLLPFLDQLSQKGIQARDLFSLPIISAALAGMLVVGVLAGIYPAFVLSGFRPVEVLKGKAARGIGASWLRNALVVFQFTISVMLIIGTVVIYSQLSYLLHMDIGFDKDQLLVIRNTYLLKDHAGAFRDELSQLPGVRHATMTGFLPVDGDRSNDIFFPDASIDP